MSEGYSQSLHIVNNSGFLYSKFFPAGEDPAPEIIQPYQGEHDGLTVCAVSGLYDTLMKVMPMMAAMPVISMMALMTVVIRCVRDGLFDYGIRDVHDGLSDSYHPWRPRCSLIDGHGLSVTWQSERLSPFILSLMQARLFCQRRRSHHTIVQFPPKARIQNLRLNYNSGFGISSGSDPRHRI